MDIKKPGFLLCTRVFCVLFSSSLQHGMHPPATSSSCTFTAQGSGHWILRISAGAPMYLCVAKSWFPGARLLCARELIVAYFIYMIKFNLLFYCSAELYRSHATPQDLPNSWISQTFSLQIVSRPVSTYPSPLVRTRTAAGKRESSFKMF